MKRFLLCAIGAFFAQFHITAAYVFKDSTENNEDRFTSFVIGGDYSTNTNTFGRFDNYAKQPSYSPYVSYLSKYGFNLGAIGYFIGNSDASGTETTSELDLQAGYDWRLGKVFSLTPLYTHFFYSSNSSTLKKSYNDYAQLSLNSEVKWWNSSISGRYLWGDYDEINLSAQTGVTITISDFLHNGNSLVINPMAELNSSDINYYRYISGNFKFLRAYATLYPDATFNDLMEDLQTSNRPLIKRLAEKIAATPNLSKRMDKLAANGDFVISDLFSDKKELKFTSLGLTLPVYYYVGNFCFSATFAAYKPFNQPKAFGNDWTAYFGVGLSYTFSNQGQNSFK